MDLDEAARAFREFVEVIKRLRTPGTGCPWDLEQDHRSLRPFLIEEAYEVLDAIDRGDDPAFREELGDLLLQVVLHAQVADDRGAFSITDVIGDIERKMVRRHPHVFGPAKAHNSAEVLKSWDQIKAAEAAEKGHDSSLAGRLAHLPEGLPALQRAQRLGEKAAKAGTDGGSLGAILAKVHAALTDLEGDLKTQAASTENQSLSAAPPSRLSDARRARLEDRLGEVLFDLCQLARRLGVHAEDSLRSFNMRFIERHHDNSFKW